MQTIGESPMASSMPPETHGRVMPDAPFGQFTKPAGVSVALHVDDVVDGQRVFV